MAWDKSKFKKPSREDLKAKLSDLQFSVTQDEGTERAFDNEYWNNHREGIYVDIVSGEPLFSSLDKFNSGTGWPSFTKPLSDACVVQREDRKLFARRIEIRSGGADTHLGHLFSDGPQPGGLRYCMNSSSLRFVPKEDLAKEGYGEFASLFGVAGVAASGAPSVAAAALQKATFAAGCFWGVQHLLDRVPGVVRTRVGYIGGDLNDPTYRQVCSGETGHAEAVEVEFDPKKVSYETLLNMFWRLHDPTQMNRQGVDVGTQYRSAIFYHSPEQKAAAEKSRAAFDASSVFKDKAVTQIIPAGAFFDGEDYHQKYFDKNGGHVCHVLRPR